jgi:hypothetical protein
VESSLCALILQHLPLLDKERTRTGSRGAGSAPRAAAIFPEMEL